MGYIYIATNLVRGMDVTNQNDTRIKQMIMKLDSLKSKIKNLQQNELLYFKALLN